MRKNPADTKTRGRRRGGGAPGTQAEILLQPREDHDGADAAHGVPHSTASQCVLKEAAACGVDKQE